LGVQALTLARCAVAGLAWQTASLRAPPPHRWACRVAVAHTGTGVMKREDRCLPPLPEALVLFIFSLVPVDQRLRCLEVCRGWRAVLLERSLWTRLDLSATAGLARPATQALLRAAAARAGGQLQALHLTDCVAITYDALMLVARANADTLTELRMEGICHDHWYKASHALVGQVEAVLGAAPRLRLLAADVNCDDATVAHPLLRNEGAFAVLRVRQLRISRAHQGDEAGVLALAADLAVHTCLTEVRLQHAPLRTLAVLDAVVEAALTLRLASLLLFDCHVTPASAPALARLISGGALTELYVDNGELQLLDQPAAALIADALRANSTLTSLKLPSCNFWQDAAGAALVLSALTAHRSLRTVNLNWETIETIDGDQAPALGAALGALVAADAPALQELDVSVSGLGDAGLGALVDALPLNTHLRTLYLADNHCTKAFIRDRLLPAVRANTSLQQLTAVDDYDEVDEDGDRSFAREAEALVDARRAAAS
jgi:hypothetical protein